MAAAGAGAAPDGVEAAVAVTLREIDTMRMRPRRGEEWTMGLLGRWYGMDDAVGRNAAPAVPMSDADRIIAAQREQGAKTRGMLLLIFVGIPAVVVVVGLVFWLVFAALA